MKPDLKVLDHPSKENKTNISFIDLGYGTVKLETNDGVLSNKEALWMLEQAKRIILS